MFYVQCKLIIKQGRQQGRKTQKELKEEIKKKKNKHDKLKKKSYK